MRLKKTKTLDKTKWDVLRHDIKNEITAIKAFAELIKRQKGIDRKLTNYAEKINTRSNEIIKLLNNLTNL